jgi:hypothetical protein
MADRLVTVGKFLNAAEAALVRNRLADHGLRVFLAGDNSSAVTGLLDTGLGGVEVQVAEADLPAALAILGEEPAPPAEVAREAAASQPEGSPDEAPAACAASGPDGKEAEAPASHADGLVDRAFRAAFFGLIFFPLQIYSLQLLAEAYTDKKDLSDAQRSRALATLLLNVPLLFYLAFFANLLFEWFD